LGESTRTVGREGGVSTPPEVGGPPRGSELWRKEEKPNAASGADARTVMPSRQSGRGIFIRSPFLSAGGTSEGSSRLILIGAQYDVLLRSLRCAICRRAVAKRALRQIGEDIALVLRAF
jgi:hypothetical protein